MLRCILQPRVRQMIPETQCILKSQENNYNCLLFLIILLWSTCRSMLQFLSRCVTHVAPSRIDTTTKVHQPKYMDIATYRICQRMATLINLATVNYQSSVACLATRIEGRTPMACCTIGSHLRRWLAGGPDAARTARQCAPGCAPLHQRPVTGQ